MALLVELASVNVAEDRFRQEFGEKEIADLAEGIAKDGLIHAPTVRNKDGRVILVAGERRIRALQLLNKQRRRFKYADEFVPPNLVPVVLISATDLEALYVEFGENVDREDLSWREHSAAIARLHEKVNKDNPVKSAQQNTADTLQAISGKTYYGREKISKYLIVHNTLQQNPELLSKARDMTEAYQIVVKEGQEKFQAELARRRLKSLPKKTRLWQLECADLHNFLPTLDANSAALFLIDPPYGIDIDKMNYPARSRHAYSDEYEHALELMAFILQHAWTICSKRAVLFSFCTFEMWPTLRDVAARMGWDPWKRPIVWWKGREGEAPLGSRGFIYTHEYLFYARKGTYGINGPLLDVLDFPKVQPPYRLHPAEKPLELLTELIKVSTIPGDIVVDPVAGSGSTAEAAVTQNRRFIGCEIDPEIHAKALVRMSRFETQT